VVKIKKLAILVLLTILMAGTVSASVFDMSDYPTMFVKEGKFRSYLVVGEQAPAEDVVSAMNIATRLQYEMMGSNRVINHQVKLDTEVPQDIYSKNLILVGKACDNKVMLKFLRDHYTMPQLDCANPFSLSAGEGIIKYLRENNKHQLIVSGYEPEDTRRAAQVLHELEENLALLNGHEIIVTANNVGLGDGVQPGVVTPHGTATPREPEAPEEKPKFELPKFDGGKYQQYRPGFVTELQKSKVPAPNHWDKYQKDPNPKPIGPTFKLAPVELKASFVGSSVAKEALTKINPVKFQAKTVDSAPRLVASTDKVVVYRKPMAQAVSAIKPVQVRTFVI